MKLVSMKVPKPKKGKNNMEAVPMTMDHENYPWGLRLNLNKEEIKKLKAGNLDAGDMVKIVAHGKVVEKRVTDSDEGGDKHSHHLEIQIQSMGFTNKSDFDGAFKEASK